ncbi:ethanolamine utilization protein [Enterococcus sp. AZ194]|uniref:hypothetical protein n=1 Tax=Enterococcus sp. AZ194 TaxID=2774629 RepID=UPI003F215CC9
MKVSEIEKIIQSVSEQLFATLSLPKCVLALDQEATLFPKELFAEFPEGSSWTTANQKRVNGLIVRRLSISQLSAIANLQVIDEVTQRVSAYLLSGKPILVMESESIQSRRMKKRYHLSKTISEMEERCHSYGLYFYQTRGSSEAFFTECQKTRAVTDLQKRSYITESQLIRMIQNQEAIPTDSHLTPLAKDYAIAHHLLK